MKGGLIMRKLLEADKVVSIVLFNRVLKAKVRSIQDDYVEVDILPDEFDEPINRLKGTYTISLNAVVLKTGQ